MVVETQGLVSVIDTAWVQAANGNMNRVVGRQTDSLGSSTGARACSRNKCAFRQKVALAFGGYYRSERGRLAGFLGNELGVVACE